MKKTVFYYGVGMPAGVAATLLFVSSPFLVREFDVHDTPEAPPLAALAAVVSTATGTVIDDIYASETKAQADAAKVLTFDEARRIAANIANLPEAIEAIDFDRRVKERGRPSRAAEPRSGGLVASADAPSNFLFCLELFLVLD